MLKIPFYDPTKSYYENFDDGPFGVFADGKIPEEREEPKYEIFGHKVHLPFGIPAGPLLNGNFIKAALDKGFDIPMHKTVRTKKRASHPWPNVLPIDVDGDLTLEKASHKLHTKEKYENPLSITNSFGNPSYDPDVWQKDIALSVEYRKKGQIVTASFEGTRWEGYSEKNYVEDWVLGANLLKETGAHFIEANLSCPNEGTTSLLCYDTLRVQTIAEAIKNEIGDLPLVLKISYFKDDLGLEDLVKSVGNIVDGFASINTISAEVVDKDGNQALPGEGRLRSGVCGAGIKWAGIDMVKRLKKIREDLGMRYTIIGVGGVTVPKDFHDYMSTGADGVMSATGAMWNPLLAQDIKNKV